MQTGSNSGGEPSVEFSEQEKREFEERHKDAEAKLRAAAKSLNEAISKGQKSESLREVHRQAIRMLNYGMYLGRSADEPLALMKAVLGDDPSAKADKPNADTFNSADIGEIFRKVAKFEFPQTDSSGEVSAICIIASSMVRVAVNNTAELITGLKDDDVPIPDGAVVGRFSLEQLFFFLHMVDRLGFRDCAIDTRREFMDDLVAAVVASLGRNLESDDDLARLAEYFADTYNERQTEYYGYQDTAWSRDVSVKNTLLWEYGKRMASLVSPRKNALRVVLLENIAMEYLHGLMPFVREAVGGMPASGQ